MSQNKVVNDVMIDVFEYPHVPYWFTIKQTIMVIKKSVLGTEKCIHPMAVLVFDEKYNILGTLTMNDILKGLKSGKAESPVSEVMVPARFFVEPADTLSKAAEQMLNNNLILLPVIEDKKKFVGVVRMIELFDELTGAIT